MAILNGFFGNLSDVQGGSYGQIVGDTSFPPISVITTDYSTAWRGLPPLTGTQVFNKYALLTYAVGGSAASQPGGSVSTTSNTASGASNGSVLAANPARNFLFIQNLATTPLYVSYGATASATVFSFILKGGTAAGDGSGEKWKDTNFKGAVSVFSATTPSYIIWES